MTKEELQFTIQDVQVIVTIQTATIEMGMKRTMLHTRRRDEIKNGQYAEDLGKQLLYIFTFSTIEAGTTKVEGMTWPVSFETFLQFPETVVVEWEQAIYRLNPHWNTTAVTEQEKKKDKNNA